MPSSSNHDVFEQSVRGANASARAVNVAALIANLKHLSFGLGFWPGSRRGNEAEVLFAPKSASLRQRLHRVWVRWMGVSGKDSIVPNLYSCEEAL